MSKMKQLFILIGVFGFCEGAGIVLSCHPYKDGQPALANATVDGNIVNGTGCISLSNVYFDFKEKETDTLVNRIRIPYNPVNTVCEDRWNISTASCIHYEPSTKVYTYQVRFTYNKTIHSHWYLTFITNCDVSPTNPNPPDYSPDGSSCNPLPFEDDTTTRASTTTHSASHKGVSSSIVFQILELFVIWSTTKVMWLM